MLSCDFGKSALINPIVILGKTHYSDSKEGYEEINPCRPELREDENFISLYLSSIPST